MPTISFMMYLLVTYNYSQCRVASNIEMGGNFQGIILL